MLPQTMRISAAAPAEAIARATPAMVDPFVPATKHRITALNLSSSLLDFVRVCGRHIDAQPKKGPCPAPPASNQSLKFSERGLS